MAEKFVKAVEKATGNIVRVPEQHLTIFPDLLKPAPTTRAAETKKEGTK